MIKERNAYIDILSSAAFDTVGREKAVSSMKHSDIRVRGEEIPFSYIPFFVNQNDWTFFQNEISALHKILSKITKRYVEDESYRKIFGFSTEMEQLICLPCPYDEMIPAGRYDMFLDEETMEYSFCEVNTDGSAGMSFDYGISQAILEETNRNPLIRERVGNLSCFETIETMAEAMVEIYRSSKIAVPNPVFCVTDFKEEIMMSDALRFAKAFEKRGISARFTDIRDLCFEGGNLIDRTDGTIINGIYRRAVTEKILERIEECRGLIDAVAAEKVVLMGHFRTSVAHSKTIFYAMHRPETMKMLTEAEQMYIKKHIPLTYKLYSDELTDTDIQNFILNKDEWIIKPSEGFASRGVISGLDVTKETWKQIVTDSLDKDMIIQQFCKRTKTKLLGPADQNIADYYVMTGVFQAAGHAAGFYNRAGKEGLIDYHHGGFCVSSLFVH